MDWALASFSRFLWARRDPASFPTLFSLGFALNLAFLNQDLLEQLQKPQIGKLKFHGKFIGISSKDNVCFFFLKSLFPSPFRFFRCGVIIPKTTRGKAGFGSGDLIPSIGPAAVKSAFLPIIIFDPGRWIRGSFSVEVGRNEFLGIW